MAHKDKDVIDFDKLERDVNLAVEDEARYWRENDAKFRAVNQKVATYEEFRDIVLASHLRPLDKNDKVKGSFEQSWNPYANKQTDASTSSNADTEVTNKQLPNKIPKDGHEFARDWRRHCNTEKEKRDFLLQLGPDNIARIFRAEISFGLLGDILEALVDHEVTDAATVLALLDSLASAGRFGLSLQFLSSKERLSCSSLFFRLSGHLDNSDDKQQERLSKLKAIYQVSETVESS